MFAPNSIKTLMGIKSYNQLDQSKENINKQPKQPAIPNLADHNKNLQPEEDMEFTPKHHKDISEKVIDTRVLIKEMDSKIADLKTWKRSQKKELERKLAENKKDLSASEADITADSEQFDSYDLYIQRLEEMMNLYKTDLDESRRMAIYQEFNYNSTISEIGDKLSERDQRLAELSEQLAIHENQRDLNMNDKALDFTGDIQSLKNTLEGKRKDFNESLRNARKNEGVMSSINGETEEEHNSKSLKAFIEKEKKEVTKVQKYDFKDDLDDIDNDLKELEDLLNSS